MNSRTDVAIGSAFGSGHWLAFELRRLGLDVTLIDFSERLGRWTPEDWEGPFGLFNSETLTQTMMARLDEEDYAETIEEGFCVWMPSGPLDMRGSHSAYLMERHGVSLEEQQYLTRSEVLTDKERTLMRKKIAAAGFRDYWLSHLAHAVASPIFYVNSEAALHGRPLPIMAPYAIRRVTRRGIERNFDWLKSHGVRVIKNAKLIDIAHDGSRVAHFEVDSDGVGVLGADQFLWTLSSLETANVVGSFSEFLFPNGPLQPQWVWVRYRLELGNRKLQETMPAKFIAIHDFDQYWTHANLVLAEKTVTGDQLDAWIRLPNSHRFHKEYLQEMGQVLTRQLSERIPDSQTRVVDFPQEYHYDESALGPARFPVFEAQKHRQFSVRKIKNFHFDGPEFRESHDWTGRFRAQQKVLRWFEAWKTKRDEERAKEARRQAQREAAP